MMLVTGANLVEIMPAAATRATAYVVPLNTALVEFEINTPLRAAAFLAQVAYETKELRHVSDPVPGASRDDWSAPGNTSTDAIRAAQANGSTPGAWFKRRGLLAVVGYDEYVACGDALGMDLVRHPHLLDDPSSAARAGGWVWNTQGLNALADVGAFTQITKRLAGSTRGWFERVGYYARALTALGAEGCNPR